VENVIVAAIVISCLIGVCLALLIVGAAVGKTRKMPSQIVIDAHEEIEFCAQALPDEVTAQISYDDLRRILRHHIEWIQAYHWTPEGSSTNPIVFQKMDPLPYILERTDITGLNASPEIVKAVIEAHSEYLIAKGALHLEDPALIERDLRSRPELNHPETKLS
jgi:hypothetical protein